MALQSGIRGAFPALQGSINQEDNVLYVPNPTVSPVPEALSAKHAKPTTTFSTENVNSAETIAKHVLMGQAVPNVKLDFH